jgi:hypothetical protein
MKEIRRVFISGPYSEGDRIWNMRRALDAADALLRSGCAPFVPHLDGVWEFVWHHSYEEWMEYDRAWLEVCDAVVRLPGQSQGADREVARAEELGIPVFYSVSELLALRERQVREALGQ